MRLKNLIFGAALILGLAAGKAFCFDNIQAHSEIFTVTNSSLTATTSTSTWVDTSNGDMNSADFYVSVSSVTGTNPTLSIKIQLSPDSGTTWFDHPSTTFSQITTTTTTVKTNVDVGGATTVRLQYSTGGTAPMFRTKSWVQVRSK